ncbi:hypothetical protein DFQ26_008749 [Actinomortierella ambigua]|nr:hypothetical protein DFQ26_008749 [Actinomortierella ambigua]
MRRSLLSTLLFASLYQVANAVTDHTRPFLAWSPQSVRHELRADSAIVSSKDVVSSMNELVDCSHKVVLFVDESELHASDLNTGRPGLKREMKNAKYSTQIAFVHGELDFEELATKQAEKCHATLINADSTESISSLKTPAFVYLHLPADSSEKQDGTLDSIISTIKQQAKKDYLVVYSSSKTKNPLTRRRLDVRQDPEQQPGEPQPSQQPSGVFHHYTFFSQGIYMALLIMFLVVPIILIGVSWNLSILAPVRFESKPKMQ